MEEELLEGEIPSLYPISGFHLLDCRCKGCGLEARTNVDPSVRSMEVPLAVCPGCQGEMWVDFSKSGFSFKMPARNFSETKQGQRFKRSFTAEGEKLARKQWDNVDPKVHNSEGKTALNPTPGGPLDPKGPWAKRDLHRVTISGIGKDS